MEAEEDVAKRKHRCLSGNFAPIHQELPLTPCAYSGIIPTVFHGGQYVRNGGNPSSGDLTEDIHMFDGDGMLSGVWFQTKDNTDGVEPCFVNRYILTDVYLSAKSMTRLQSPILPSIATLTHPLRSTISTFFKICRLVALVAWSFFSTEKHRIRKISVANTSVLYHDKRALATCQTGPPMRIQLPGLDTVGWFNGQSAANEYEPVRPKRDAFGCIGPLGFLKDWTTAHPHVDPRTGDLISFQSSFLPPFVWYSLIPKIGTLESQTSALLAPVPGVSKPKFMHDFGVSALHIVIMDLPLTLDPINMLRGQPIIHYNRQAPSRFGVFPRRHPERVRWFETEACFIFHTASTWDETTFKPSEGFKIQSVNMVACRYTNANMLYSMGAIEPIEKDACDSQLYYYRFLLSDPNANAITHQWPLSAIPFEMPIVSTKFSGMSPKYVYGCSSRDAIFGAETGQPMKIDCLVKIDVHTLIERGMNANISSTDDCIDKRHISDILSSEDPKDPIKVFQAPEGWYVQEPQFVPQGDSKREDQGYLLTIMFDESQLDVEGHAGEDAKSELWIIDACDMTTVVAKIHLPQRVPYGFHGHWFSPQEIKEQRPYLRLRKDKG